MDETIKDYLSKLGKKGGRTTKKRHGADHFKNIGREGALKRWGNRKKKNSPKKSGEAIDTE